MFYIKNPQVTDIQLLAYFKSRERDSPPPSASQHGGFQDKEDYCKIAS